MRDPAMAGRGIRHRPWLSWVAVTTAGWLVGGALGSVAGYGGTGGASGALVVAGGAVAAGIGQWLVLRRAIDHAVLWLVATVAAVPIVAGLVVAIEPLDWGSAVALGGFALGVTQWVVLRRHARRASLWILASAAGWIAGGLLSGATAPPAGWVVIGVTYGVVTGTALVLLLGDAARTTTAGHAGA